VIVPWGEGSMHIRTTIVAAIASLSIVGTGFGQVTFEFTDSGQALGGNGSNSVALGDLDGDGDLDAMVANNGANTVWLGDGNGTFTNSGQALGNSNSISVALGDLDGDGDLDAMVANANNQPNTVWTNDNGTFTNSGSALGNSISYSVALGDLDGDGALDAMVANYGQPNTVWTNDGSGTFTNSGSALGNSNSYSVALGDLDGDGDLDAMVANNGQPNTVWTNTVTGTGVCCAPSGCTVSTENLAGYCEQLGGVYLPNGSCSDCSMVTTGACCYDGLCFSITEAECTEVGGAFTAEPCSADTACPTPCSSDVDNDGDIDIHDLLNMLSDWGDCQ